VKYKLRPQFFENTRSIYAVSFKKLEQEHHETLKVLDGFLEKQGYWGGRP